MRAAFILAAALILPLAACSTSEPRPRIVFAAADFDAGTVDLHSRVSHSFAFKNEGTALLRIDHVGSD